MVQDKLEVLDNNTLQFLSSKREAIEKINQEKKLEADKVAAKELMNIL